MLRHAPPNCLFLFLTTASSWTDAIGSSQLHRSVPSELDQTASSHDVNLSSPALYIRRHTQEDDSLQALIRVLRSGWPHSKSSLPITFTPYFAVRDQLVEQDGILYKGQCVLIPEKMRSTTLQKLHASHIGINGCILRASMATRYSDDSSDRRVTFKKMNNDRVRLQPPLKWWISARKKFPFLRRQP